MSSRSTSPIAERGPPATKKHVRDDLQRLRNCNFPLRSDPGHMITKWEDGVPCLSGVVFGPSVHFPNIPRGMRMKSGACMIKSIW
jgi:hypothetical protein